jgi:TolA-binding protein
MVACQSLKILAGGTDSEFAPKSSFEIGRCLFLMGKFDQCIQYFTQMLAKYPKHASFGETLFFMGQSYEKNENKAQAVLIYKKALAFIKNEDDAVYMKASRALKALED